MQFSHILKPPLQLKQGGKTSSILSFNDQAISDGKVVIDLVDAVKPGSVDYKLVKDGTSDKVIIYNNTDLQITDNLQSYF